MVADAPENQRNSFVRAILEETLDFLAGFAERGEVMAPGARYEDARAIVALPPEGLGGQGAVAGVGPADDV